MKGGFVYIMTNRTNKVLYTGVTSDLVSRVLQHKESYYPKSFTSRYKCFKLVYFEIFDDIVSAIEREKIIKGKVRKYKEALINANNPTYNDLWNEIKNW